MRIKYLTVVLVLWMTGGLLNAQADIMTVEDLLAQLSSGEPGTKIAYGDDSLQFGELYMPEGDGPFPVVTFIHGGCWLAEYDITTTRPLAWALRDEGLAVWNLEYRRVGNPGGTYPGLLLDIGSGIDHLRNLAEDHPLNLGQVVVMGHSAGGHLALWAGARPKIPARHDLYQADPLPLAGVVALAPAAALTKLHQQDVCDKVIDRLMDGSPAERPDRYAYVEPVRMAPIGVPQTLLMGVYDTNWTPHGEEYYTAARAIGDNMMRRVMAPEAGHFEVINPSSTTWPLVLEAVRFHLQ